jgi:hypothetical protein
VTQRSRHVTTACLEAEADVVCRGPARCGTSVVLDAGRRYAFRYLADGGRWFNDDADDDYQMNGFGSSDPVVDLTASG